MTHSEGQCRTDRQTDRQAGRQTDDGDFIGPSNMYQGSTQIKYYKRR